MKKYNLKKKEFVTKNLWDIESKNRVSSKSIDDLSKTPQLLSRYLKTSIDNTFSELLFRLTHQNYSENKAFKLWTAIVKHKIQLNRTLDRDVGILVATLDYLTNITSDISNPKIMDDQKIEEVVREATRDALTGLYMRNVFEFFLNIELLKSRKFKRPLSLLISDIDNFKIINDSYGHQKGDEVLKQIARLFIDNSRQFDLPARYGGEEFAIILGGTPIEEAFVKAERLREQVFQFFRLRMPTVTISIGVSSLSNEIKSMKQLIVKADTALYAAKQSGKNKVMSETGLTINYN